MMHSYLNPFFLFQLLLELWRTAPGCTCNSNQGRAPCRCQDTAPPIRDQVGTTARDTNT